MRHTCLLASMLYITAVAKIVDQIVDAIERSGESRYAISKATGISQSVLSRLVNGERALSMESADILADYLRLSFQKSTRRKEPAMNGVERSAYSLLRAVVSDMGGDMTWHPKGTGGTWTISLWGKQAEIDVYDDKVNALDACYEPPEGNSNPQVHADWPETVALRPDVKFRVARLVDERSEF